MKSPLCLMRWVVLAITLLANLINALICDFNDDSCIDPLAQVSLPVRFEPLFPGPVGFYYAFDAQSSNDPEQSLLPEAERGPTIKVSFWLQYDRNSVGSGTVQANRTTEIALRVGNLTGFRGGRNHGCDGVWGPQCSQNLKQFLQQSIHDLAVSGAQYSSPLQAVLQQLSESQSPPTIPDCPASLFQVDAIPVQSFVEENELHQTVTVDYPGSSTFPWKTLYIHNTTPPEQAVQMAVGIFSRGPSWESAPLNSADEVQIELVCTRAPKEPPPYDFGPASPMAAMKRPRVNNKVDSKKDDDNENEDECYPPEA